MTRERRGICSVCQEERSVTAAGRVRYHVGDICVGGLRQLCSGTGLPPASYVADPVVAAERRGYARAIADLRAEAQRLQEAAPDSPHFDAYDRAAEFLEEDDDV